MSEPKKAYYVLERFEGYKKQLVYANNAHEAKAKTRRGEIEECVGDDGPHPAGIGEVRRAPFEDRP
jgi:hypothetical protein